MHSPSCAVSSTSLRLLKYWSSTMNDGQETEKAFGYVLQVVNGFEKQVICGGRA